MSYYTRIDLINLRVKPEHAETVARAIKGAGAIKTRLKGTEKIDYMLFRMKIDSDGVLDWIGDTIGKWRPVEELAIWLSQYCSGGFIA